MTIEAPLRAAARLWLSALVALVLLAGLALADGADAGRFVGSYTGSAEIKMADGTTDQRDMSVTISQTKKGFTVAWTSTTRKPDGTIKAKSYEIDFVPSDQENVFAAAMRKNVFGHEVQLDPMKGEPYVWARINGDTLTVYSLFVDAEGGYELQQYDRTLAEGGLELDFQRVSNGEISRSVHTFLKRVPS